METGASVVRRARSGKVIGLVSTAHFLSHFYMLLLPPLFPLLREVYGVGYTELGLAVTAFSVTTGLTQAPLGFLVDRYGARAVLIAGLVLESATIALIGLFPTYGALVALMMAAGVANAVYHPADYAILNASVERQRIGRAFSVHTFAGYLGNAVAPLVIVFLMGLTDWRIALALCGIGGGVVALTLGLNSEVLRDAATGSAPGNEAADGAENGREGRTGLRLLFSAPILLGVLFFVGIAVAGNGINKFGVAALSTMNGTSIATASVLLSAYLFASPPGVLLGGWVADRIRRHDLFAALCFVAVACAIFPIAAFRLPIAAVGVLLAAAGLFIGLVSPSRDMMIRAVTPPREIGKVFGFVSTGYNIGGVVSPVLFGYLLDNANPQWLFWTVAIVSLLTVAVVLEVHGRGRRAALQSAAVTAGGRARR